MSDGKTLRIGYVLAEFPSVTETFIANEIQGLLDCGACVTVFALRRGCGDHAPNCPVFYRDSEAPREANEAPGVFASFAWDAARLEHRSPPGLLYALRNVGSAVKFARLIRRAGINHLHAHFAFIPTDIALMIARQERVSVTFSAHAWDVYRAGASLPQKIHRAALCITCTEAAKRHLVSLFGETARKKVVCIHHGTDLKRFPFRPRGQLSSPPHILAVGRLVSKKGFDTLLQACRRLKGRVRSRCTIVGRGPLESRLKALAGNLGLGDTVRFVGAKPYREMPDFYAEADVLAVPSVVASNGDRDGLPNVVVEALASGVPVVGSRVSGIPEAVEHECTGLLCRPGDSAALAEALCRILTDGALRSRCTAQGRRVVEEKFDAAANSRRVLAAMEAVRAEFLR